MAIYRTDKKKNYTKIDNGYLKDSRLSYAAKGLLTQMLSVSDSWDFSLNGLKSLSSHRAESVHSAIEKLQEYGYLVVTEGRDQLGRYCSTYDIYESPALNPEQSTKKPKKTSGKKQDAPKKEHKEHENKLQQTQFNSFEQRDYDFNSLEKKLFQ